MLDYHHFHHLQAVCRCLLAFPYLVCKRQPSLVPTNLGILGITRTQIERELHPVSDREELGVVVRYLMTMVRAGNGVLDQEVRARKTDLPTEDRGS